MLDTIILFVYYKTDDVTLYNFHKAVENNPGVLICPVSNGIPGSTLPLNCDVSHEAGWDLENNAWLTCDMFFYRWYNMYNIRAKRYICIEWDTLCLGSLSDFFSPVWDADVAGGKVVIPGWDDWYWFSQADKYPKKYEDHLCGVLPMGCIMFSDRALNILSNPPDKLPGISEMRVGTMAKYHGFEPIAVPGADKTIHFHEDHLKCEFRKGGIYHPNKKVRSF